MVWYRQAMSHQLSQCWPRSMSLYGVIRPQYVHVLAETLKLPGKYSPSLKQTSLITVLVRTVYIYHWPVFSWRIQHEGHRSLKGFSSSWPSVGCAWWRHDVESFLALLALCEGNPLITMDSSDKGPVMRSFDVSLYNLLNKQSNCRWFEKP